MPGIIRKAKIEDLERVQQFLRRANLGTEGLTAETIASFFIKENDNEEISGTLGIEVIQGIGLLRSLVVSPGHVEEEIIDLLDKMVQLAIEKGIDRIFLATNKAATVAFFELLGFKRVEREELPQEFYHSEHIRHVLNVDNSLFLKLSL